MNVDMNSVLEKVNQAMYYYRFEKPSERILIDIINHHKDHIQEALKNYDKGNIYDHLRTFGYNVSPYEQNILKKAISTSEIFWTCLNGEMSYGSYQQHIKDRVCSYSGLLRPEEYT